MNKHESTQIRLVYEELTTTERERLQAHVAACPECTAGIKAIQQDRDNVKGMERFQPRLELGEELYRSALRDPGRRAAPWKRRLGIAGAAAILLALVATLTSLLLPGHTAPPVGAEVILQQVLEPTHLVTPSTGTAYISYNKLPSDQLPVNAAVALGAHLERVHWVVRDRTHFRFDITTITPRIDASTTTVVVRGTNVEAYDSETGYSIQQILPSHGLLQRLSGYMMELRFGAGWPALPEPIGSIHDYLVRLAKDSHTGVQGHVREVGQQHLAEHRVSVFDVRPAVWTDVTQPCYLTPGPHGTYPSQSHCATTTRGYGWARLWIDRTQRLLLKYQEFGFPQVENPASGPSNYLFRVQSIHDGPQPLSAIRFTPPITPVHVGSPVELFPLQIMGGGDLTRVPTRFVAPPYPQLPVANPSVDEYGFPGLMKTFGFDVVWRHSDNGVSNGLPPPRTRWYHGSYLFFQQRWRPTGLPRLYRSGPVASVGRCAVWTGRYPAGGRWMSLQHNSLAIVVSAGGWQPRLVHDYVKSLSICLPL